MVICKALLVFIISTCQQFKFIIIRTIYFVARSLETSESFSASQTMAKSVERNKKVVKSSNYKQNKSYDDNNFQQIIAPGNMELVS